MANGDKATGFVSGDERLAKLLSDPDLRAHVDEIVAEQDAIDHHYRTAVEALRDALAAAGAHTTDTFATLDRHLTHTGFCDVSITLRLDNREVTVPLHRIATNPDR